MKISYNWLKDYLKIDLPTEKLSDILTNIGLEVEGIEEMESIKGGLKGLVIGEVVTCEKHPDADKLSVTKVNVGGEELLDIVCGAPNVAAGQKVVVATVGTTLYSGDESFKIKKAKIRGQVSQGMICAEDEIGMGGSHDGIIVLDADAPIGKPASEYFNISNDIVFEIGLTPNRIDGASHYGVARDLAVYLSQEKETKAQKPDVSGFKVDNTSKKVDVIIDNKELCPRYSGLSISGIQVKPSPEWMQNNLKAIGLNPINNIVDITNYILHEIGQPMHAFDANKIRGNNIVVKTLDAPFKFTTLDEVEHDMLPSDLMICDGEGPVAIAGVFGGLDSGITDNTTEIFLESAYFNPTTVRKTAKRNGISTDSSFRFERGTDPNNTVYALKRAALLIKELAGGEVSSEIIDNYPLKIENHKVVVKFNHIHRLIGKEIEKSHIKNIISSLEISIDKETETEMELSIPPYRVDVTREADVIEEILRIYGYNNVEINTKLNSTITYVKHPDTELVTNSISEMLSANGFNEIMSNSLTNSDYYKNISSYPAEKLVMLENPNSLDLNCMRQTLLFNGLEAIIYNTNRQISGLKLFEFGNCYEYDKTKSENKDLSCYSEYRQLALFISGAYYEKTWDNNGENSNFFHLKNFVSLVLVKTGLDGSVMSFSEIDNDIFTYGMKCSIGEKEIVKYGLLNNKVAASFDIKREVFVALFNWDNVLRKIKTENSGFTELPKFPYVKRDLALLIDEKVTYAELEKLAFRSERKLLKQVTLFDVYQGEKIEQGKKSYALSFVLQDENGTLTDKKIEKVMNNLMNNFKREFGAQIR